MRAAQLVIAVALGGGAGWLAAGASDLPDAGALARSSPTDATQAPTNAGVWVEQHAVQSLDELVDGFCAVAMSPVYRDDTGRAVRLVSVSYDLTVDGFVLARSSFLQEVDSDGEEGIEFSSEVDLPAAPSLSAELFEGDDAIGSPRRLCSVLVFPAARRPWGELAFADDIGIALTAMP